MPITSSDQIARSIPQPGEIANPVVGPRRSTAFLVVNIGPLLLAALLITSCVTPTAAPTRPPPTPLAEPTASSVPIVPSATPSGRDALAACDTQLQAQAMRPSQMPDWSAIGLSACYELTLELLPDENSYTGTARVTFTNLTGGDLLDLVFRVYPNAPLIYGGDLEITGAQADGVAVTPDTFLSDRTAVRVPLDDPLQNGATVVVTLAFEGRVPRDLGSGGAYGIFNLASAGPVLALANWYPILAVWRDGQWSAEPVIGEGDAVVSDVALYRASISAPANWQVVTTGTSFGSEDDGNSIRHDFVSGPVRDFTVLASPAFEAREAQFEDVRVVHWGLPGGEAGGDDALEVARDSTAVYTRRFGPYPYTELDIVAVPLQNAAGVEYPGLILIEAGLYSRDDPSEFLFITIAHEVAHQWWYGVVGNDVLASPWQDEALATFSSDLYLEAYRPSLFQRTRALYRLSVQAFQDEYGEEPVAQPLDAFRGRSETYGVIVYLKGALFFDELRDQIGDEAFFQALQTYYERSRYTIASPEALLGAFEDECGCDLRAFYAEWGVASS